MKTSTGDTCDCKVDRLSFLGSLVTFGHSQVSSFSLCLGLAVTQVLWGTSHTRNETKGSVTAALRILLSSECFDNASTALIFAMTSLVSEFLPNPKTIAVSLLVVSANLDPPVPN